MEDCDDQYEENCDQLLPPIITLRQHNQEDQMDQMDQPKKQLFGLDDTDTTYETNTIKFDEVKCIC